MTSTSSPVFRFEPGMTTVVALTLLIVALVPMGFPFASVT